MFAQKITGQYLAVIGLIIFSLYAFLLLPNDGQAVSTTTVGQLQWSLVPEGTEPATEFFDLGYTSPAPTAFLSLDGWKLLIDGNMAADLDGYTLQNGQPIRFCSASTNALPGCVPLWNGEVFPDTGATVELVDGNNARVAEATYADVAVSEVVYNTYDWQDELYAKRDQVQLCITRDGAAFKLSKEQATKVVDGLKNRTVIGVDDIVPPFYYRFDAGMGYFAGQNWTAQNELKFGNGCQ